MLQRLSLNPTACAIAIKLPKHTGELSWILSLLLSNSPYQLSTWERELGEDTKVVREEQ